MKAELTLSPDMVKAIAEEVVELLKPQIATGNGKHEDDELLNTEEVAELLRTTREQIYQWVHNAQHGLGDFPYVKAGKLLRFSKKKVLQWLENRWKGFVTI